MTGPSDITVQTLEQMRIERDSHSRAALAAGLRELADWVEQHPEVSPISPLSVYLVCDSKDKLAVAVRAMAPCVKYGDDKWFGVKRSFGPIVLNAYGGRSNVCERIVKDTHEVTREIPDPDAPKVLVTETVEDVEWVCEPLLAVPKAAKI